MLLHGRKVGKEGEQVFKPLRCPGLASGLAYSLPPFHPMEHCISKWESPGAGALGRKPRFLGTCWEMCEGGDLWVCAETLSPDKPSVETGFFGQIPAPLPFPFTEKGVLFGTSRSHVSP